MKQLLIILFFATAIYSCKKEDTVPNINVEGYWNVIDDTTFTVNPTNATSDLFHLFKGSNSFYRLSFLKTHDFSNLNSRPRNDSLISFYKVEGNQLMLTNGTASFANVVGGNNLISRTDNEMIFTRYVVERRSAIDGSVIKDRLDTIRYIKVTDQVKVAYFDNYLSTYHK